MKRYARKLGILGGMGPEATAAFYLSLIGRCQRELGAKYNSDFPQIFINSAPVPDGLMWKGFHYTKVRRFLQANIRLLEGAGADFAVVPCNSAHAFLPLMRKAVRMPVMSIVEETTRNILEHRLRRVLLLATSFTASHRVYDQTLSSFGIELVKPNPSKQRRIEELIIRVEGGHRLGADRTFVAKLVDQAIRKKGIEGVVAGCTEIPLLIHSRDLGIHLFDTISILAASAYEILVGRRYI
jgi:aspartate racemase